MDNEETNEIEKEEVVKNEITKDDIDRVLGTMTREQIEDWLYHNRKIVKTKNRLCSCGSYEIENGEYYCKICLMKNPFLIA